MFYGKQPWDPQMIISQMLVLQCSFYLTLGLCFGLLDFFFGAPLCLDQFFAEFAFNSTSIFGWSTVLATILNSIICGVILSMVVERAKKCLDFAVTVYFYHFIGVCIYDGMPSSWEWWLFNIISIIITVVLGEALCVRKEMHDIPLSSGRRN